MPVRPRGGGCYQWGSRGKVYCGRGARGRAERQGRAAYSHGYRVREDSSFTRTTDAIDFVRAQPTLGLFWPDSIAIETIPFDRSQRPGVRWAQRHRFPVQRVRVADLVASQYVVGRGKIVELLENGWTEPILVEPYDGKWLIADGHHRAYAASLLGDVVIDAYIGEPVTARRPAEGPRRSPAG